MTLPALIEVTAGVPDPGGVVGARADADAGVINDAAGAMAGDLDPLPHHAEFRQAADTKLVEQDRLVERDRHRRRRSG